jgi:hypothetical protein
MVVGGTVVARSDQPTPPDHVCLPDFRALLPLVPPAPFSHNGEKGDVDVLMPETDERTQGLPKKSTPGRGQ